MAYDNNIIPGNPPLNWEKIKTAFDRVNENFTIIGATLGSSNNKDIAHIESGTVDSNPVKVVTVQAHGFTNGQRATITDTGVSQLDGNTYYVNVIDNREFTLYTDAALTAPVNGTAYDSFPSGGGDVVGLLEFSAIDFENFQSNIIPNTTNDINLGSFTKMFKEVHVETSSSAPGSENNGLWLGLAKVQGVGNVVDLPLGSTVDGELIINPNQTFFKSVQVDNGDQVVADEFVDVLNLLSGTAISMSVDSGAESITITNTGVTQLSAGLGISVSSSTGNITVTNTGVRELTNTSTLPAGLTAGAGIAADTSTGTVTLTNTGVIEVDAGFGITVFTDTATGVATVTNNAPAVPTFQTFAVQGQPGVSPDNTSDTIEFVQGYGIRLTTDAANDKITFDVDNRIDIIGTVFGDDSTVLVDGINNEIYGTIRSDTWMLASDSYLTIANGGATGPGPIQIVASANLDLTAGAGYNINITAPAVAQAGIRGDLTGSVFADDSTKLVDGVEGKIVGPVEANVTGDVVGNVTGDLVGNVTGNVVGNVTGNVTGYHTGDMTGSVFADDSSKLVDAVEGLIVGPVRSDDIRGTFIGSVFADDSSLVINSDGSIAYTPTTPSDWDGDAPTTVGEALDRLAAVVKVLNGGTGA